jgi:hypothetical protein
MPAVLMGAGWCVFVNSTRYAKRAPTSTNQSKQALATFSATSFLKVFFHFSVMPHADIPSVIRSTNNDPKKGGPTEVQFQLR